MQVTDDPRVGTELAGYRIESLLGWGGMSVVYLAEDLRLKRRVALKLLAADLAGDESFRDRFLRESELAASIDHPNIVPIYEAGATEDVLFIAMRYVGGRDLKRRLRGGRLDAGEAIGILAQTASALDAAHARGLVHRDVKPSNVLLDPGARPDGSDHVYLADFGITKRISEETAVDGDGHLLGTLDYVAPEQITGEEIDGRADIYSLGCVLYECLVGRPPFRRDSELALVFAHLEADPPVPSVERPDLSVAFDAVIARALAKEPEERYGSCRELARAALAVAAEEASRELVDVAVARRGRQKRSRRGRNRARRQGDGPAARPRAGADVGRPGDPRPRGKRRDLPLQGAGDLRAGRCGLLLRPGAPRGRAGRAPRRRGLPRDRRAVGERQVVGPAGGPRPRPGRRRAARQRGLAALAAAAGRAAARSARHRARLRRSGSARARPSTRCPQANASCWSSTSSRSCSRPAAPMPSGRPSPTRSPARPATRTGVLVVVVALRADFYGRFAAHPGLADLLGANHVLVGPMRAVRAAARSRAAGRAGSDCGWSRSWPMRSSTTSRASRARCRCFRPRCSSSGRSERAAPSPSLHIASRAACTVLSPGWPRARTPGSRTSANRWCAH